MRTIKTTKSNEILKELNEAVEDQLENTINISKHKK